MGLVWGLSAMPMMVGIILMHVLIFKLSATIQVSAFIMGELCVPVNTTTTTNSSQSPGNCTPENGTIAKEVKLWLLIFCFTTCLKYCLIGCSST
jgi:hypothetical protein